MRLTVIVLGTEPRAGSWSRVLIFFKGIAPQFDFRNVHGSDGLAMNTSGPKALADSIREVSVSKKSVQSRADSSMEQ